MNNVESLIDLLSKTEAFIEASEVDDSDEDSFHNVIDALEECIDDFEFERLMDRLPSKTEGELNTLIEIKKRYEALHRMRDAKIIELGYDPD